MEQRGGKNKPYTKVFYDLLDHQLYPITWLREYGGTQGVDWDEYFEGKEYVIVGMDNEVGTNGDLYITIHNSTIAFQFVMFKVGGARHYEV